MNAVEVATWRRLPLAAAVAGFGLAYAAAPTENGAVTCLLRLHTGQACPGCGMTRALGRMVHGDLGGAAGYHPWIFALVLQLLALVGWLSWRGRRPVSAVQVRIGSWLLTANAVALLGVWLVRILTGHLDGVY